MKISTMKVMWNKKTGILLSFLSLFLFFFNSSFAEQKKLRAEGDSIELMTPFESERAELTKNIDLIIKKLNIIAEEQNWNSIPTPSSIILEGFTLISEFQVKYNVKLDDEKTRLSQAGINLNEKFLQSMLDGNPKKLRNISNHQQELADISAHIATILDKLESLAISGDRENFKKLTDEVISKTKNLQTKYPSIDK